MGTVVIAFAVPWGTLTVDYSALTIVIGIISALLAAAAFRIACGMFGTFHLRTGWSGPLPWMVCMHALAGIMFGTAFGGIGASNWAGIAAIPCLTFNAGAMVLSEIFLRYGFAKSSPYYLVALGVLTVVPYVGVLLYYYLSEWWRHDGIVALVLVGPAAYIMGLVMALRWWWTHESNRGPRWQPIFEGHYIDANLSWHHPHADVIEATLLTTGLLVWIVLALIFVAGMLLAIPLVILVLPPIECYDRWNSRHRASQNSSPAAQAGA